MKIRIKYCHECMFLPRATEIARDLLDQFSEHVGLIELEIGSDGVFDIEVEDVLIFQMGEDGIQPSVEMIRGIVGDRLS